MTIYSISYSLLLALSLTFSTLANAAENPPSDDSGYLVQPGDVLEISVWREEGLEKTLPVRPDGALSLPLAGDIQASGRTVDQVRQVIAERLSKYIPEPEVTVIAMDMRGNRVYVIGKVNRPGEFPVPRPVDIVQALAMAGGTTPYAAINKIKVLRRENGILSSINFRFGDIEKGIKLEQNIVLQSGDVVLVP